jgi:hypothetical protein
VQIPALENRALGGAMFSKASLDTSIDGLFGVAMTRPVR